MKICNIGFDQIKTGVKDMDVRLYDENKQKIKIGDTVTFLKLPDLSEKIDRVVAGYAVFPDFKTLFSCVGGERGGWRKEDSVDFMVKDMEKFYSREELEKFCAAVIFVVPVTK